MKIYGAGGYRSMEGYQSGFLISPDGHILTALSYVLDTDHVTVTLDDGRRFDARMLGGDPRLEVAVLKIERHAVARTSISTRPCRSPPERGSSP